MLSVDSTVGREPATGCRVGRGAFFMHSRFFKSFSFALIFFVVTALFATRSRAQSGIDDFRPGEVLVEIKPGASIDAINERQGTSTLQRIYGTNFYRLVTPKRKKEAKFRK